MQWEFTLYTKEIFFMKKIIDIYNQNNAKSPVFSFEFFPPKSKEGEEILFATLDEIKKLNPAFVSVTYGAGGSTRGKTHRWVDDIQNNKNIVSMAHFTCIGAGRHQIRETIDQFVQAGIKNIMALRGDLPKDQSNYRPPTDGFHYANELIDFLVSLDLDLSIGAACYPEKHQDAKNLDEDIGYLKQKVDSGAEFLITQLFFENDAFFRFREICQGKGIQAPMIPGIMPITSFKQIERFIAMASCHIPAKLIENLKKVQDDPGELLKYSLEYSISQCRQLLDQGVPGIHFYTLNRSGATREIVKALED